MKVLFINDSTTNPNWGGRAATISLRMMICQSGGTIFRTITIEDICHSSLDRHVALEAQGPSSREVIKALVPDWALKLRRRLAPDFLRAREESLIPREWGDYDRCAREVLGKTTPWPGLLEAMEELDVAVVFGDGDIYGNGIVPRTLLFLSFLIKKRFEKPVVMLNHTADFDDPDLLDVAKRVYPLFDDVVFRDQMSVQRYMDLCAGRFAPDTAFLFKPASRQTWAPLAGRPTYFDVWPDSASFDPSAPYLCVGGSSIFGPVEKRDALVTDYLRFIEHLRGVYSGQIVLTASDRTDLTVFRPVSARSDLPLIGPTIPVQQAVDILGNADAYIGGRWHPAIFALRGGTPVLPLSSKTFKMQALTDMAGLSSATFGALEMSGETKAIGRQLQSYLEQGEDLRRRLDSWAEEMAKNSWENVSRIGPTSRSVQEPDRL